MRVFGIAGYSGTGKTTLIEKLIPYLVTHEKCTVAVLKHTHHDFDWDTPGKDSFRHRQAGATQIMLSSSKRWIFAQELNDRTEPGLAEYLAHFQPCDLVLVEGFKTAHLPKLEVWRALSGKTPLYTSHPGVVALACDTPVPDCALPIIDINDIAAAAHIALTHAVNLEKIR